MEGITACAIRIHLAKSKTPPGSMFCQGSSDSNFRKSAPLRSMRIWEPDHDRNRFRELPDLQVSGTLGSGREIDHQGGFPLLGRSLRGAGANRLDLLVGDAVQLELDFHRRHGQELGHEVELQLAGQIDVLLKRSRHQVEFAVHCALHHTPWRNTLALCSEIQLCVVVTSPYSPINSTTVS